MSESGQATAESSRGRQAESLLPTPHPSPPPPAAHLCTAQARLEVCPLELSRKLSGAQCLRPEQGSFHTSLNVLQMMKLQGRRLSQSKKFTILHFSLNQRKKVTEEQYLPHRRRNIQLTPTCTYGFCFVKILRSATMTYTQEHS